MAGARLVLAGLFLIWGAVPVFGEPPPELQCPLLDERGSLSPRPALLRILGGPEAPPQPEPARDPERTFDVIDPWGFLEGFRGPSRCELSPTAPLRPPHAGAGAAPSCRVPPAPRWWLLALATPRAEGTALLRHLGPRRPPALNASLFISTLTPNLRGLLGTPQTLHCSLAPAPAAFTLEWLHHRHGVTRRLLAFDSAASRPTEAAPGVLLLLGGRDGTPDSGSAAGTPPPGGALEVSLQLSALSVSDEGSFVCSVTTPHGQVQQVLRMNVIAPPQVSLLPPVLTPGLPAELRCDAVGFFPLDVEIRWERRARGDPRPVRVTSSGATSSGVTSSGVTWSSGHRRVANGTFSRSAGLRVSAVTAGDSYSCVVTHPAWDTARRVTVEVAGATGPSVEDMAGMALVAFVIGGLCLRLWPPDGR